MRILLIDGFAFVTMLVLLSGCREEIQAPETFIKEYGEDVQAIPQSLMSLQNGNYLILGATGKSNAAPIEYNELFNQAASLTEIQSNGLELSTKLFPIASVPSLNPLYELSAIENKASFLDGVIHPDGSKTLTGMIRGPEVYIPFLDLVVSEDQNYLYPFVFRLNANDDVVERRFLLTEQLDDLNFYLTTDIADNSLKDYAILLGASIDSFNLVNRPRFFTGFRVMLYNSSHEPILDREFLDPSNLRLARAIHLDDNGDVFLLGQRNRQHTIFKLEASDDYTESYLDLNGSGFGDRTSPTGLGNYPRNNDNILLMEENQDGDLVCVYTRVKFDVFVEVVSKDLVSRSERAINNGREDEYAEALCLASNGDIIVGTRVIRTNDLDNSGIIYRLNPSLDRVWQVSVDGWIKDIEETPEGDLMILHDFQDRNGTLRTHITKMTTDGEMY